MASVLVTLGRSPSFGNVTIRFIGNVAIQCIHLKINRFSCLLIYKSRKYYYLRKDPLD